MRKWTLKVGTDNAAGLVMEKSEIPNPSAGQVRIKIRAASINYRDQIVLKGTFGNISRDIIPLSDGAGIIDALGEGVTKWKVGDLVTTVYSAEEWIDGPPIARINFGLGAEGTDGVLAEYIVLSENRIASAPKTLSLIEASTLPCAALTAWTALNGDHPYKNLIKKGDKVLALGTGGVSLFALLLAKAAGAELIGTSSQDDKLKRLYDLGVSHAVNYNENKNWGEIIFNHTSNVERVINAIGGSAIEQSIKAVGYGGEIAFMGLFDFSDQPTDYITLMTKGASIRGTAVGSHRAHQDMVNFIDKHEVKPPVDKIFDFEDAVEAYKAATSRDLFGKIVIKID